MNIFNVKNHRDWCEAWFFLTGTSWCHTKRNPSAVKFCQQYA